MHGIVLDLLECRGKIVRIAADLRAALVRAILARTRDRHLDERRCNRRNDCRRDEADDAAAVIVTRAASAEDRRPLGNVCSVGNNGRHRRRNGRDQNIAVLHVRELMTEHARDLIVVERAHKPRCHSDCCIRRIAPRRKSIRCILIDHVDTRHRKLRTPCEFFNQSIELGRAFAINLLRIVHTQYHAVGEPV